MAIILHESPDKTDRARVGVSFKRDWLQGPPTPHHCLEGYRLFWPCGVRVYLFAIDAEFAVAGYLYCCYYLHMWMFLLMDYNILVWL